MSVVLSPLQDLELRSHIMSMLGESHQIVDNRIITTFRSVFGNKQDVTDIPLQELFDKMAFNKYSLAVTQTPLNSVASFHSTLVVEFAIMNCISDNEEMVHDNAHIMASVIAKQLKSQGFSVRKVKDTAQANTVTESIMDGLYNTKSKHSITDKVATVVKELGNQGIELFQPHVEQHTPESVALEKQELLNQVKPEQKAEPKPSEPALPWSNPQKKPNLSKLRHHKNKPN